MKLIKHLFITSIFGIINLLSLFAQNEIITSGSCEFTFSGPCHYTVEYKIEKEKELVLQTFYILYFRINSNDCKIQNTSEYYLHYNFDCEGEAPRGVKKDYLLTDYSWTQMTAACINAFPVNFSINQLEIVSPDKHSQYSELINKKIALVKPSPVNTTITYPWSDWFGPYTVIGYDQLSYRIKYQPQGGGIYFFKIEFTNNYAEFLEFKYVLEPKWFNHSVDKSIGFDILDGDVKEDKHTWKITEPGTFKVEDMTVTLFNVMKNYDVFNNTLTGNTNLQSNDNNNKIPCTGKCPICRASMVANSIGECTCSSLLMTNKHTIEEVNNPVKEILDTVSNMLIEFSNSQKVKNNTSLNQQNQNNSDPCGTSKLSIDEQNRRTFGYTEKLPNGKYKHFTWNESTCSWKTKIDNDLQ